MTSWGSKAAASSTDNVGAGVVTYDGVEDEVLEDGGVDDDELEDDVLGDLKNHHFLLYATPKTAATIIRITTKSMPPIAAGSILV